ncbi:uncharacterized protein LOC114277816 isoform X3 [Camellia sinensis]|uniref:uncharacterized protein LOC114277816 isoform X3 n=1 Tax=Camellia sinensis TaxID=4442 RepID=UPI00103689D1|nr:uncharacterized protein LOC114277816 isoform X3 [Camellia sinensis]XP_028075574.1 uncharacterized protein LOC114277816 isoform X3 [Camellia sinensis]
MKLLANYLIGSSNDIHNQLYSEQLSEVSEVGPCLHYSNSHSLAGTQFDTNSWGLKDLASYMDNRQSLVCNDGKCSADGYLSNRRVHVWQLVNLLASVHVPYKSLFLCQMGNEGVATIEQMQVNDTFGGDHVKRITDGLDFEPLDLKYWFILNSRLDGAIILFVMRGKIMDGFSLKLSS